MALPGPDLSSTLETDSIPIICALDGNATYEIVSSLGCLHNALVTRLPGRSTPVQIQFPPDDYGYHWTRQIGNSLSRYWNTRAIAYYHGVEYFHTHSFGNDSFARFLPNRVPGTACWQKERARLLCQGGLNAKECNYNFAHGCYGNFEGNARKYIIKDTQTALLKFAENISNNLTITIPPESELVFHDRCSGDSMPGEVYFGHAGFSAFQYIPAHIKSIVHLYHPDEQPLCLLLREGRKKYVLTRRPDITYTFQSRSSTEDFATLVFSRNLMLLTTCSSFNHWGAAASSGRVWSPRDYPNDPWPPSVDAKWIWMDTPQFTMALAKQLNILAPRENSTAVLAWFQNN